MLATGNITMRDAVQAILAARLAIREKIESLDQALKEVRNTIGNLVGEPTTAAKVSHKIYFSWKPTKMDDVITVKHSNKSVVVKHSTENPHKPVWEIIKASQVPLSEDEIAIKLMQEGFDTDLPPEELVDLIYTEAINPMIQSGLIEPVGNRPNRKYKKK